MIGPMASPQRAIVAPTASAAFGPTDRYRSAVPRTTVTSSQVKSASTTTATEPAVDRPGLAHASGRLTEQEPEHKRGSKGTGDLHKPIERRQPSREKPPCHERQRDRGIEMRP